MAKAKSETGPSYPADAPPLEKFKVPPLPVKSDDLIVHVGRVIRDKEIVNEGTPYPLHAGETVWILPLDSMRAWLKWGNFVTRRNEIANDAEHAGEFFHLIEDALDEMCEELARRIVAWDWKDIVGDPLPQPYHHPEVIRALEADEISYLMQVLRRENPGEEPAASAD